jgi:hypothetical protein
MTRIAFQNYFGRWTEDDCPTCYKLIGMSGRGQR